MSRSHLLLSWSFFWFVVAVVAGSVLWARILLRTRWGWSSLTRGLRGRWARTPDYREYMRSHAWRRFRRRVLKFWDYRCATCGFGGALEVHHRDYSVLGRETLSDVVPLCNWCHEAVTPIQDREGHRAMRML